MDLTQAPGDGTVSGLVRAWAGSTPHGAAIIDDDGTITWSELDATADRIAAALLAQGIRRGDMVALLAPNQRDWLEVMVGSARIGACVVPLNTWYKDDELVYGLEHSRAKILLAVDQVRSQDVHAAVGRVVPPVLQPYQERLEVPGLPALETVVSLGTRRHPGSLAWQEFLDAGVDHLHEVKGAEAEVELDDPLYLVYTSGSSARPKGVLLLQGHTVQNAYAIGRRQGLVPDDRTWMVQPLFWALASVNMLFSAWGHGSSVVLQRVFDAGEALEIIERHRATRAYAIGNIVVSLTAHPDFASADLSSLTKGVSLFTPADRRAAMHQLGMTDFVSVYGSTETHAVVFSARYDDPVDLRLSDSGTLLDGWEYRLVRPGTTDVLPDGIGEGEILVRGRLSPGYYEDPEQTAAAFDSDGFFHTGDMVRVDEAGRLEFTTRLTEMIKTGGINVAPAEVEDIISKLPGVRQVHVVGVTDDVKGEIVVAVVEAPGLDESDVRGWVTERAAGYKVPARVLFTSAEAVPRLASGKIAKRQLRADVTEELRA